MRNSCISILLLLIATSLNAQFRGYNMVQMGRWDNDSLPSLGTQYFSNCWGWYDSVKMREYAIVGSIDSTYFIDVTNPSKPKLCDVHAGKSQHSVWREYKTYKHYAYAVADAGQASLQIFDMSYLPDSVHKVYDNDSLIMRSHTIWIDKDRLYANSVTTGSFQARAVDVFSLADPVNPEFIGTIIPPVFGGVPAFVKCHDAFIRNDTLFCSGENGGLFIYNMADALNPQMIGAITDYPERGYNHSSHLSDDGKILVFTDENHGLGLKAYDVSDLQNIELQSIFRSHQGAIAHNPYFIGRKVYVSYYHDGVYVFDLSDPKDPKIIAWYDTYPQNAEGQYGGFEGCWGVYPYLPSGNILAIDMTNGLIILHMDITAGTPDQTATTDFYLFPNPANSSLNIEFDLTEPTDCSFKLVDPSGRLVFTDELTTASGRNRYTIDLPEELPPGIYLARLAGSNLHICKKLFITD